MPNNPRSLKMVSLQTDHSFHFHKSEICDILLQNEIKDRKIMVLSVAGVFRKGKSFLLGFFLKYLRATYQKVNVGSDWLGDPNQPLQGFSWRGGSKRETSGINMWSEVFLYDYSASEKIAIILLDTQGVFDNSTTTKECVGIFSLSTLLSSVQVYNIMQQIREDDLQHLELFTQYGRLISSNHCTSAFQNLLFVIRDWQYPTEHPWGFEGGDSYVKTVLEITENQASELQSLRKNLSSCFSELKCFLMARPGDKVCSDPNFDGRLNGISPEFIENLKDLMPSVLDPENLVPKAIGGAKVTAAELVNYLESFVYAFNKDDAINPKSLYLTTAETSHLNAQICATSVYNDQMKDMKTSSSSSFENEHKKAKSAALEKFNEIKKIGDVNMTEKYLNTLETDIENLYQSYKRKNDAFILAEKEAKDQAERSARALAESEARALKERNDKELTEKKAKEQAERSARELAESNARTLAEIKARAETERKTRESVEKNAKESAERDHQELKAMYARALAESNARAETERKTRESVEKNAKESAERDYQEWKAINAEALAESNARAEAEKTAREKSERRAAQQEANSARLLKESKAKECVIS